MLGQLFSWRNRPLRPAHQGVSPRGGAWRSSVRRHRAVLPTGVLITGALAIATLLAVGLSWTLSKLHHDAIERSKRESAEFSAVLAGQTARFVEGINLVLEDVARRVSDRFEAHDNALEGFSDRDTHAYLKRRLQRLASADVIAMVNASGRIVSTTRMWPAPSVSVADRDYLQQAKAGAKGLVISSPIVNRVTGKTEVFFARRIESAIGEFLGAVIVGSEPRQLIDANAADTQVEGRRLVLSRRDGVVLAQSDGPTSLGWKFPPTSPWYKLVDEGGGNYRSPGYSDSIARLIAIKPLKDWPLVVNVSEREDAALNGWYQVRRIVVAGGSVATLIGLSLLIALLLSIRKLVEAQQASWKLAHEDTLTVLPNRRALRDYLDSVLIAGGSKRGAILFVDLDRFKSVNDSLGHAFGDELLRQVADRLRALFRQSDVIARIGGDEFVIVIEGADAALAASLGDRVIDELSKPFHLGEINQANVGASVGIRLFSEVPEDGDKLIDDADRALYEAKLSGRGRSCVYRPQMEAAARDKLSLDARMRRGLESGQFALVYQPIVAVSDLRISGVEALVRWNDPERGVVLPGEFIPLAEETGFIEPLSRWIFDAAFAQMAAWRADHLPIGTIAVNLAFRHFKNDGFVLEVKGLLEKHGLPAHSITLEITECITMWDEQQMKLRLFELCDLGFSIALDDFGTGHSSLSMLRHLPIHRLKIDRSFLRNVLNDPVADNVTSGIISLAKSLQLEVIAEGIESEEQLRFLKARGCDLAQGYLLGRPMPAADIVAQLRVPAPRLDAVA